MNELSEREHNKLLTRKVIDGCFQQLEKAGLRKAKKLRRKIRVLVARQIKLLNSKA